MTHATRRNNAYAEQLTRYARALATAQNAMVFDDLEEGEHQTGLGIFVSANVSKRLDRLRLRLQYLAENLDDRDALLTAFVREVPLTPYSTLSGDADHFLGWLEGYRELTPEQRDHVACQHAHFAVEAIGRNNRLGHVRFQELLSVAHQLAPELETDLGLRIYLNPIRAWSRLVTKAMLDEETSPPVDALFYAVRDEVKTAVLDPVGRALVDELSSHGPCSLDDWANLTEHADFAELVGFCCDLCERGIVAFG
jgi:hypothetical protein